MNRETRLILATPINLSQVDLDLIAPVLADFRSKVSAILNHLPGGKPNTEDLFGIARRVARDHGVTPEDLVRWHQAVPEAAQ